MECISHYRTQLSRFLSGSLLGQKFDLRDPRAYRGFGGRSGSREVDLVCPGAARKVGGACHVSAVWNAASCACISLKKNA